jgi:transposase
MPQLTEIQKQLITQRFANGISVRAIANEMRVSKNTIQLAKQKIRDFGNIINEDQVRAARKLPLLMTT